MSVPDVCTTATFVKNPLKPSHCKLCLKPQSEHKRPYEVGQKQPSSPSIQSSVTPAPKKFDQLYKEEASTVVVPKKEYHIPSEQLEEKKNLFKMFGDQEKAAREEEEQRLAKLEEQKLKRINSPRGNSPFGPKLAELQRENTETKQPSGVTSPRKKWGTQVNTHDSHATPINQHQSTGSSSNLTAQSPAKIDASFSMQRTPEQEEESKRKLDLYLAERAREEEEEKARRGNLVNKFKMQEQAAKQEEEERIRKQEEQRLKREESSKNRVLSPRKPPGESTPFHQSPAQVHRHEPVQHVVKSQSDLQAELQREEEERKAKLAEMMAEKERRAQHELAERQRKEEEKNRAEEDRRRNQLQSVYRQEERPAGKTKEEVAAELEREEAERQAKVSAMWAEKERRANEEAAARQRQASEQQAREEELRRRQIEQLASQMHAQAPVHVPVDLNRDIGAEERERHAQLQHMMEEREEKARQLALEKQRREEENNRADEERRRQQREALAEKQRLAQEKAEREMLEEEERNQARRRAREQGH